MNVLRRHGCLVVDSIEESAGQLHAATELEFLAPFALNFVIRDAKAAVFEQEVRFTFSADRSLELVEASEIGPFARRFGLGLHHYGVTVDDFKAAMAEALAAGAQIEWQLEAAGELIAVFYQGRPGLPGRFELVDGQVSARSGFRPSEQ